MVQKLHPFLSASQNSLDLDLSPLEAAEGLRHCEGMVFLDSSTARYGQFSVLAVKPNLILQGSCVGSLQNELNRRLRLTSDNGLPNGAAIGYLDYEGNICFGFYDDLLIYHHGRHQWFGSETLAKKIRTPSLSSPPISPPLIFSSDTGCEEYCEMVQRVKNYIAAGDIYQVNVTYPFQAVWDGDGFAIFESLRHYSPAPFSAFLKLGEKEIISSSPELFLRISGRQIVTRPIKGTRPRSREPERDELAAYELLTSAKEVAELVMITDLERNDLGKICEYGSVRVTELLKLERFEQVFHLVSTVEAQLRSNVTHVDALLACFPGGSITGAPKKRAREIIRELEGRERGIYTGAIGYFGYNGESQFSIAIRTLCKERNKVSFSVGAGIVADSIPEKEYQETLDKAAGILLAASRMQSFYR